MGGDGCSAGMSDRWKLLTGSGPPWEGCCDAHDKRYNKGGSRRQRRMADKKLRQCVSKEGYPVVAFIMWSAVRTFGAPAWPHRYRWGNKKAWKPFDHGYG